MSDWQPIETAPKDGERILLAWGIDAIEIGWWKHNGRTQRSYFAIDHEMDDYELADDQPTHWMPLPLPPQAFGVRCGVAKGEQNKA